MPRVSSSRGAVPSPSPSAFLAPLFRPGVKGGEREIKRETQAVGRRIDVFLPPPGYKPAVSEATDADVDRAVAAAAAAFPAWAALSPAQRGRPLARLAQLISEADGAGELARLDALALGRPVSSYFDGHYAATQFRYFAEAAYPVGTSSLNTPGFLNVAVRQPYGVAAAIIPWNCPLVFLSKKLAPALAAGNAVVLKTSEKAPLSPDRVAAMLAEAGFPPGVVNILHGHGAGAGHRLSSVSNICLREFQNLLPRTPKLGNC